MNHFNIPTAQRKIETLRLYLDRNSSSQGIKIFKQLPNSDLIPGIPILLSEHKIRGEVVQDAGPALRGGSGEQFTLGRSVPRRVKKPLENLAPRLPQSRGHRRMVHPRPQSNRFPVPRTVRRRMILQRRGGAGEGGSNRDCSIHSNCVVGRRRIQIHCIFVVFCCFYFPLNRNESDLLLSSVFVSITVFLVVVVLETLFLI